MRSPLIAHVDMDCFYVSVERLLDASLRGKPVIVGGPPASRAVVSSASYEARKFGVRSAMPCAQAARLCPEGIFVSGSMEVYGRYSRMIREVLETFSPLVEMASQDEAYVDLTGTERRWGTPLSAAQAMRRAISARTALPCSVAVAPNRIIAKIASDLCKPAGMIWVPDGSEAGFMRRLDVWRMPGVGPKAQERLRERGIRTVAQLQDLGAQTLEQLFPNHGSEWHRRAMGHGSTTVVPARDAKSVSNETTFDADVRDGEKLRATLLALCENVGFRLRASSMAGRTIELRVRFPDFSTISRSVTLGDSTQEDDTIYRHSRELLAGVWREGVAIRLIGVGVSGLSPADQGQTDLLRATPQEERRRNLYRALDAVKERHGPDSIGRAASRKSKPRRMERGGD